MENKVDNFFISDIDNGGAEIFWDFSGKVAIARLQTALAGVLSENSPFFALTVPSQAIRTAAESLAKSWDPKYRVVEAMMGGLVIQRRYLDENGKQAEAEVARIFLGADKTPNIVGEYLPENALEGICALYYDARSHVDASGMGDRLSRLIRQLSGVSLRDKGGIWYAPPSADDILRKVKVALNGMGIGVVSRVPIMRCADAAESILRALTTEIEAGTVEISQWVADQTANPSAPGHQENGQELRAQKITTLEKKVEAYQKQLGLNVDGLANALHALKNRVVNLRHFHADATEGRGTPATGERGRLEIDHPILGQSVEMHAPVTPQVTVAPTLPESTDARFALIEWD